MPGERVQLREVGARDGLQSEAPISVEQRVALIEALLAAGVTELEVAAFVSPKAVPSMADAAAVVAAVEVLLATMGTRPQLSQRAAVEQLENVELVESDYALEWMQDPWRQVDEAGEWLLQLAKEHAVDLVHLNGYSYATLSWNRPVLSVAHSCVVTWWRAVHREDAPAEWDEYRRRVREGLCAADRVVAPTAARTRPLPRRVRVGARRGRQADDGSEPRAGGEGPLGRDRLAARQRCRAR
jgi:hypothetical protein